MIEKDTGIVIKCDLCRKVLVNEDDGFIVNGDIYAISTDKAGVPNKTLLTSSDVVVNSGDTQLKVLCKEHFLEALGIVV